MSLTTEQLLIPRYKVIADYPGNNVDIGRIFESKIGEYYDKFPAVFRLLAWCEEREENDMPLFIKMKDTVYKVDKWEKDVRGKLLAIGSYIHYNNGRERTFPVRVPLSGDWQFYSKMYLPATEEDYNNQ